MWILLIGYQGIILELGKMELGQFTVGATCSLEVVSAAVGGIRSLYFIEQMSHDEMIGLGCSILCKTITFFFSYWFFVDKYT